MPTEDNFLSHYGVKGMKWGRRKAKEAPSEDYVRTKNLRKKSLNSLSNDELRKLNERLQLERSYRDLTSSPTALSRVKKGREYVKAAQSLYKGGEMVYKMYKKADLLKKYLG